MKTRAGETLLSQKLPGGEYLYFSSFLKEASRLGYIFHPLDGLSSKCEGQKHSVSVFQFNSHEVLSLSLIMKIAYYYILSQLSIFAKLKKAIFHVYLICLDNASLFRTLFIRIPLFLGCNIKITLFVQKILDKIQ